MKYFEHLLTLVQGFGLGALVMAYVADYNRGQLPLAVMFLVISIIFRILVNREE